MSGKCRPSLRAKTLENVKRCNLSQTDKDCIKAVFEEFERVKAEKDSLIKTYNECQVDNLQEYAHRLENKLSNNMDISMVGYQSVIADIEQTYKEMVGEG